MGWDHGDCVYVCKYIHIYIYLLKYVYTAYTYMVKVDGVPFIKNEPGDSSRDQTSSPNVGGHDSNP